jgi:hypothetical protein
LKIITDPVTVDEVAVNGEPVKQGAWDSEYSFKKTFPEGKNRIVVVAKNGNKKAEKTFNFKVDLSERKRETKIAKEEKVVTKIDEINNKIPGLEPIDIYVSLQNRGFKTEKRLSTKYSFWYSKSSAAGIDYNVTTYTENDVNSVVSVTATAMLNGEEEKDIVAVLSFLQFIASAPYKNADPQKAIKWVETNFNKDKVNININDVTYTIYSPTNRLRMLTIEKTQKQNTN